MEVKAQPQALATLPLWKCLWHPLSSRLNGPQSLYGHSGDEKNILPLPGIEP